MAYCRNCGKAMDEGVNFCPACGTPQYQQQQYQQQQYQQPAAGPDPADARENKAMAILSYLGILLLIPLFAAKDSPFARFHTNQGLILLIAWIVYWVAAGIISAIFSALFWRLGVALNSIFSFLNIIFLVPVVMGIVNAAQGEMKELPLIGGLRILK